jgi:hypothetical protein
MMKCPNTKEDNDCDDLEEFRINGLDNYASNGDAEIYVGRMGVMCCPTCQYIDIPYFV